jgi:uncharacterized membrane protein YhhN
MQYLSFIALGLSILGSILTSSNSRKARLNGFITWIMSNILWLSISIHSKDLSQIILWSFYILMSLRGIKSNLKG